MSQQITTREQKTFPLSKDDFRELALQGAGITKEELGSTLRKAFDRNKELLDATRVEVKVVGMETTEIEVPDNTARQRAVDAIYDITGVRRGRTEGGGGGGPTFVVNFPSYYDPKLVTTEVIDAEAVGGIDDDGSQEPG